MEIVYTPRSPFIEWRQSLNKAAHNTRRHRAAGCRRVAAARRRPRVGARGGGADSSGRSMRSRRS